MQKYKVYIKAVLFILMVIGLFGFANNRNNSRKIKDVQTTFINGDNLFISSETVDKLLTQISGNIKNKSKENIALAVIENGIEKNEMIENAEVYLTVDGILKTKVLQRKPIARILVNGSSYYLDDKGKKMPLSKNYSARVPIVTGVQSDVELKQIHQFIKEVLSDEFMEKQIIGIRINSDKEFVLKTRMGNQIIEFGKLEEVSVKIKKLEAFYQKVVKDNSLKKYSKISLKYSKQVVCKKR